jgi:predicted nuclease of predicted toxin-antitoxin system
MKLLIDANLSWRLVNILKNDFPEIIHVTNTGLADASADKLIWEYAMKNNYSIVTNDEDFYLLSISKGFPPKIILLKTGNQSTRYIATILIKHKSEISDFVSTIESEYGVLEIY